MVEGGRTPVLSPRQLEDLGYRLAIFPVTALLASAAAMQVAYARLQAGRVEADTAPLMPFAEMTKLMGFEDVWDFEKRHAQDD
jgi:2-methylisocitrate lyase-like PEP mutase family enzyme